MYLGVSLLMIVKGTMLCTSAVAMHSKSVSAASPWASVTRTKDLEVRSDTNAQEDKVVNLSMGKDVLDVGCNKDLLDARRGKVVLDVTAVGRWVLDLELLSRMTADVADTRTVASDIVARAEGVGTEVNKVAWSVDIPRVAPISLASTASLSVRPDTELSSLAQPLGIESLASVGTALSVVGGGSTGSRGERIMAVEDEGAWEHIIQVGPCMGASTGFFSCACEQVFFCQMPWASLSNPSSSIILWLASICTNLAWLYSDNPWGVLNTSLPCPVDSSMVHSLAPFSAGAVDLDGMVGSVLAWEVSVLIFKLNVPFTGMIREGTELAMELPTEAGVDVDESVREAHTLCNRTLAAWMLWYESMSHFATSTATLAAYSAVYTKTQEVWC